MSNEELAVLIQQGESQWLEQLWEQTERFIRWRASQYYGRELEHGLFPRYELDDLTQEGFLALWHAVEWFSPEKGTFLTALDLTLKTAFAEVADRRRSSQKNDALKTAFSGDKLISEDTETNYFDVTPDQSVDVVEQVESGIFRQQLHDALERAMAQIPDCQAEVLRRRYYAGETQAEIAEDLGTSHTAIYERERDGLKHLYRTRKINGLDSYLDRRTDFYAHVGVTNFKSQGGSVVERIAEQRERRLQKLAEKLMKRSAQKKAKREELSHGAD